MGKRALITGVTGQDGSYIIELLLENGERSASGPAAEARIDALISDGG
jgi:GDP-D-mannose dehydratase